MLEELDWVDKRTEIERTIGLAMTQGKGQYLTGREVRKLFNQYNAAEHRIVLGTLFAELEEARQVAKRDRNADAMVAATELKAAIAGYAPEPESSRVGRVGSKRAALKRIARKAAVA